MTMTFPAKYPGRCDECGDQFEAGESIGYTPGYDRPVCGTCADIDARAVTRKPDVPLCPDCRLVYAGECW